MSSRTYSYEERALGDPNRRIANMIRVGTIEELDEAKAMVRVRAGEFLTNWIPWTLGRAGNDRHWTAPEPGEQVIFASPSGDMSQAVVLGSIYQNDHPAPANSKETTRTEWQDGAFEQYNREEHKYDLEVPAGGHIRFVIGSASLELTDQHIELKIGGSSFVLSESSIEASIGSTSLELTGGGTTLRSPSFNGVQS